MTYTCPYCNKPTTITDPHIFNDEMYIDLDQPSDIGKIHMRVTAISCPDPECNKLFFKANLSNKEWDQSLRRNTYYIKHEWQLLPESSAKVLPDYIPAPIQEDYYEACRIRDLSPKASATLLRRCLQGMIRDFHGISLSRLIDEVDALEHIVEPDIWESIDAVRTVGNIGAHMERDINLIVEVEPKEVQLLISLIEQLIEDWYVARKNRKDRADNLKSLAESKKAAKTLNLPNQ